MFGSQFCINFIAGFAELDSCESAIVDRKFLLDNVRFDGDSQVVGLPCEVGCRMIVHTVFLKVIIAEITP